MKLWRQTALACAFIWSGASMAAPMEDGFYLHWNVDHTERAPRPVYPLDREEAAALDSYWLDYEDGQLVSVRFFHGGKPGTQGDYGAHELVRHIEDGRLVESYRDAAGARTLNADGVWETVYEAFDTRGHWAVRRTLGADGQPVDVGGYAELRVERDSEGRRIFETRFNAVGEAVPEHNGFDVASFAFDANDFALYRRNSRPGEMAANGDRGFAEVRFRFDAQGNFLSEDVFDAEGSPKNFPAGYAHIAFSQFDRYGRPHRIELATEGGEPFGEMPVIERFYTPSGQRAGQRYFLLDGKPGRDGRGAHEVRYHYDASGIRTRISRHDESGAELPAS